MTRCLSQSPLCGDGSSGTARYCLFISGDNLATTVEYLIDRARKLDNNQEETGID